MTVSQINQNKSALANVASIYGLSVVEAQRIAIASKDLDDATHKMRETYYRNTNEKPLSVQETLQII